MVRAAEREASRRFQQGYEVVASDVSADWMRQRGLTRLSVAVLSDTPATWIGVTGAPAYINEPGEDELPSEHSTRAPTASRSAHGMLGHTDPEHTREASAAAAAWELPNPLPEWCLSFNSHVEAPGGSTHGWRGAKSTYQQAVNGPVLWYRSVPCAVDHSA